ncbi:MAG: alpha/beta hydrolase domain-containing protein [Vicinamibacterales bacterium]
MPSSTPLRHPARPARDGLWTLTFLTLAGLATLVATTAEARVVRLRIERREPVLEGRPFGAAGAYEKLVGRIDFALDPALPQNALVVDLALAPRNPDGLVEFSADFYMLKPVDPARGNGRVFYEVGNRGSKALLTTFQKSTASADPTTADEFGTGALMRQGYTLMWMGWQWDVPAGRMRMDMPIATDHGKPITGLVRGNFILNTRADTALLADRNHDAYPVVEPTSGEHVMTKRALRLDPPQVVPRDQWKFAGNGQVSLEGGFEPGTIYDVVYLSRDPRVIGCGLAGTRDIISFLKYERGPDNPMPTITRAIGWGVSQSGRFLRHFLYQGFNEDERGRQAFDGVFDQVGGAGRGSFNHRFGQASRDALHHYNILYPVDMFPFTDGPETDPETGQTDALLARATASRTAPKVFHLLTNSEYFNRAGSLVHTDPTGTRDADVPANVRIYMVSSAPHIIGPFPPESNAAGDLVGQAALNPLDYRGVIRALFKALDEWVVEGAEPPPSRYPRIADGTLVAAKDAGWPAIPGKPMPLDPLNAYRLDFGPQWAKGIVSNEPPKVGKPFVNLVPAVDPDGNDRAGIRMPDISVPLATQKGWNFRHPSVGAPTRLATEIGSYIPFPRSEADRQKTQDPRRSIEERYRDKAQYVGRLTASALALVDERFLLPEDLADIVKEGARHWDWATRSPATTPER